MMKPVMWNWKVVLIIDNCSMHMVDIELDAVEQVFLLASAAMVLQPMDQAIKILLETSHIGAEDIVPPKIHGDATDSIACAG